MNKNYRPYQSSVRKGKNRRSSYIIVFGIRGSTNERDIFKSFKQFGWILDIEVKPSKKNENKSEFAFVHYRDISSGISACEFSGVIKVLDRVIRVEYSLMGDLKYPFSDDQATILKTSCISNGWEGKQEFYQLRWHSDTNPAASEDENESTKKVNKKRRHSRKHMMKIYNLVYTGDKREGEPEISDSDSEESDDSYSDCDVRPITTKHGYRASCKGDSRPKYKDSSSRKRRRKHRKSRRSRRRHRKYRSKKTNKRVRTISPGNSETNSSRYSCRSRRTVRIDCDNDVAKCTGEKSRDSDSENRSCYSDKSSVSSRCTPNASSPSCSVSRSASSTQSDNLTSENSSQASSSLISKLYNDMDMEEMEQLKEELRVELDQIGVNQTSDNDDEVVGNVGGNSGSESDLRESEKSTENQVISVKSAHEEDEDGEEEEIVKNSNKSEESGVGSKSSYCESVETDERGNDKLVINKNDTEMDAKGNGESSEGSKFVCEKERSSDPCTANITANARAMCGSPRQHLRLSSSTMRDNTLFQAPSYTPTGHQIASGLFSDRRICQPASLIAGDKRKRPLSTLQPLTMSTQMMDNFTIGISGGLSVQTPASVDSEHVGSEGTPSKRCKTACSQEKSTNRVRNNGDGEQGSRELRTRSQPSFGMAEKLSNYEHSCRREDASVSSRDVARTRAEYVRSDSSQSSTSYRFQNGGQTGNASKRFLSSRDGNNSRSDSTRNNRRQIIGQQFAPRNCNKNTEKGEIQKYSAKSTGNSIDQMQDQGKIKNVQNIIKDIVNKKYKSTDIARLIEHTELNKRDNYKILMKDKRSRVIEWLEKNNV